MTASIPQDGGTIAASPDPPYYYNDQVTLTATAGISLQPLEREPFRRSHPGNPHY